MNGIADFVLTEDIILDLTVASKYHEFSAGCCRHPSPRTGLVVHQSNVKKHMNSDLCIGIASTHDSLEMPPWSPASLPW